MIDKAFAAHSISSISPGKLSQVLGKPELKRKSETTTMSAKPRWRCNTEPT